MGAYKISRTTRDPRTAFSKACQGVSRASGALPSLSSVFCKQSNGQPSPPRLTCWRSSAFYALLPYLEATTTPSSPNFAASPASPTSGHSFCHPYHLYILNICEYPILIPHHGERQAGGAN